MFIQDNVSENYWKVNSMTYLFCSPDSTGYRKTKNDARIEGGLFLFGERVVARVHKKFESGFWSFHSKFVSFEIFHDILSLNPNFELFSGVRMH